jgi:hypothetical protein
MESLYIFIIVLVGLSFFYLIFLFLKNKSKDGLIQISNHWEGWNYNPKNPYNGGKKHRIRYLK